MFQEERCCLNALLKEAEQAFSSASSVDDLSKLKQVYLGSKGQLSNLQKKMSEFPLELRAEYGQLLNTSRSSILAMWDKSFSHLQSELLHRKLVSESLDVSAPSTSLKMKGVLHPLTLTTRRISSIFEMMGFEAFTSPEVETEYYNFTALNTGEDHPARDEQDTFYTDILEHIILRSHVSPFQVHAMAQLELPLRAISCGRVYRNEEVNPRKQSFFHQLEAIYIDTSVNLSHLKWTLQTFLNTFFSRDDVKIRFRPDFFPFTEPSMEVDARCLFCHGEGCSTCGFKGWIELLGCGLIDPNVLEQSGIDSSEYSGFALGLGIERFAMLEYGIADIRNFYSGNLKVLRQFA